MIATKDASSDSHQDGVYMIGWDRCGDWETRTLSGRAPTLYLLADYGKELIQHYSATGELLGQWGEAAPATAILPCDECICWVRRHRYAADRTIALPAFQRDGAFLGPIRQGFSDPAFADTLGIGCCQMALYAFDNDLHLFRDLTPWPFLGQIGLATTAPSLVSLGGGSEPMNHQCLPICDIRHFNGAGELIDSWASEAQRWSIEEPIGLAVAGWHGHEAEMSIETCSA
jgi:hypothetical protein